LHAWFADDEASACHHLWYLHVASGQNLRTRDDLPIALTKKMAHAFAQAPPTLSVHEALRGDKIVQARGLANRDIGASAKEHLRRWALGAGLHIASWGVNHERQRRAGCGGRRLRCSPWLSALAAPSSTP
jgi:hypothetical protein